MTLEFELSAQFQVSPGRLYGAWLDSGQHSAMTGARAQVSDELDAAFSAWDGYIHGRNLELDPPHRIVQAWRTVEFADSEPDSRLEITFEPTDGGALVTIRHSELPPHGEQYRQGWIDSYFEPMKRYFEADE